jgi:hypothetical protein
MYEFSSKHDIFCSQLFYKVYEPSSGWRGLSWLHFDSFTTHREWLTHIVILNMDCRLPVYQCFYLCLILPANHVGVLFSPYVYRTHRISVCPPFFVFFAGFFLYMISWVNIMLWQHYVSSLTLNSRDFFFINSKHVPNHKRNILSCFLARAAMVAAKPGLHRWWQGSSLPGLPWVVAREDLHGCCMGKRRRRARDGEEVRCGSNISRLWCGQCSGDGVRHCPERMGQGRPLHWPPCQVGRGYGFVCPWVSYTPTLVSVESIAAAGMPILPIYISPLDLFPFRLHCFLP